MSETIRIRTTPNGEDKYLKVKIDQEFDFIEVLSMKITQEDFSFWISHNFNSVFLLDEELSLAQIKKLK